MEKQQETEDQEQTILHKTLDSKGSMIIRSYSKGQFLGSGGFAKVYKLTCDTDSQVYAGKIIPKDSVLKIRAKQKLMNEIKIHKSLNHTNIVRFHSFFEDETSLYILMEYCKNQTLTELLRRRKRITEVEVQCYLRQLLMGLKHIHSHRVIHRDLKLANLFISESMELKIGDFGLSAKLEYEGERKRTLCGTPNYMAPEILEGNSGHSYECDIWSVGVIMFTLLCGKPPFETGDIKKTYNRIKTLNYCFPDNVELSFECRALISSILVIDYAKRPTIDEILNSPLFLKNPIPDLLPFSSLAIPPSSNYIKQFEGRRKAKDRSSTHENASSGSSLQLDRGQSKERNEENRGVVLSNYNEVQEKGPLVWIVKWIDYSHKYGTGYVLSNNWLGILFNDKTRILTNFDGSDIRYYDDKKNLDKVIRLNLNEFPKDLYKKVMLIQVFKKNLKLGEGKEVGDGVVVKNWIRTPHCTIFRMADKTVQVFFQDRSELILVKMNNAVVFVDKVGVTCCGLIARIIEEGRNDLVKRLKYTKEVLMKMVKSEN